MNGNFKGFPSDVFLLLELNKFNDSKDFYESVKEDIKNRAIIPMRNLAADLYEDLYKIDDKMNLNPVRMVSRIRRDTRFSKNKQLYRANVWCMFMRDKQLWRFMPCMWFEFYPESYSYGIGLFRTEPSDMEVFRKVLSENQDEFLNAVKKINKINAVDDINSFKKEKAGSENIRKEIKKFYNAKDFCFISYGNDMNKLVDGSIIEEIRTALKAFTPMYKFLLKVSDKIYENGD